MLLKLIYQRLVMQKQERSLMSAFIYQKYSRFMNYHTPFKALYAAIITESYVSSFTIYLSFSSSTLRSASSQTDTDVTRAGRFVCDHVWYLNCDLLCVGGRTCQIQNSVVFSAITLVFKAAVRRNKESESDRRRFIRLIQQCLSFIFKSNLNPSLLSESLMLNWWDYHKWLHFQSLYYRIYTSLDPLHARLKRSAVNSNLWTWARFSKASRKVNKFL